jgi:hypothetical protein
VPQTFESQPAAPAPQSSLGMQLPRLSTDSNGALAPLNATKSGAFPAAIPETDATEESAPDMIAPLPRDVKNDICVCGKPAEFDCSRCGRQGYCSSECQRTDWKDHRENCKAHVKATRVSCR